MAAWWAAAPALAASAPAPRAARPGVDLDEVIARVPPLSHDASGRLPVATWLPFRLGAQDRSFQQARPWPDQAYRELARRGLTQRLPLDPRYVRIAQALARAGAGIVLLDAEGGDGPAGDVGGGRHLGPVEGPRLPCPGLLEGWQRRAQRIRAVLEAYRDAGVAVDAVWLDWEVEPHGRERQWTQARACPRCRRLLPPGVLDSLETYAAFMAGWRRTLLSQYVAQPVLEVFPRASVTNWSLVASSTATPAPDAWGVGARAPVGLGLFNTANPVAYGNSIYRRLHWDEAWSWPLDADHMDRVYLTTMLRQISAHAANAAALAPGALDVPWVARYCPDDPDAAIPEMSRPRYREALRHVFLRGADALQVFNPPRPSRPEAPLLEVIDAVAVYDEMLAYRAVLEGGEVMVTDVPRPDEERPLVSGRRRAGLAVVRATAPGPGPLRATLRAFARTEPVVLDAPAEGATYLLERTGTGVRVRAARPAGQAPRLDPGSPGGS